MISASKGAAMKRCFYPHPYLSDAHIVARVAVISATMVWAMAVLLQRSALSFSTYTGMQFLHEDIWGALFLTTAAVQLYRTWFHSRPHGIGSAMNSLMAFLWTYNAIGLAIFWTIVPPGGFAASLTMMFLSWFNLIATAKKKS